jgi:hypothetical protein
MLVCVFAYINNPAQKIPQTIHNEVRFLEGEVSWKKPPIRSSSESPLSVTIRPASAALPHLPLIYVSPSPMNIKAPQYDISTWRIGRGTFSLLRCIYIPNCVLVGSAPAETGTNAGKMKEIHSTCKM